MSSENEIRECIEGLVDAIREMDIDRVRTFYSENILSFDFEPPLVHVGVEAKASNWASLFANYRHPLGYDVRDLSISVAGDVAFSGSLNRISGMLKNGNQVSHWVRCTNGFRKIDGRWLVVHDHISVPSDAVSGKAMLDLEPE